MKYVLGGLALLAAVIIVGCSATTLFLTAFNSVIEPWQQWLQGVGIASIVAWEAAAVLCIYKCFRARYAIVGIGALVLLVLAMAVTTRQEFRLQLGSQADASAGRTVAADDRARIRNELDRAYARRDKLQAMDRLTSFQRDELADVKERIQKLEARWDTRTESIHASGNVEGEFVSKFFAIDADTAQKLLDTLPVLLFWMVARVFAIPAAVIAISALRSEAAEKPKESPEAVAAPTLPAKTETPVLAPSPRSELTPRKDVLEKISGVAYNPASQAELDPYGANQLRHLHDMMKAGANAGLGGEPIVENLHNPDPDGSGSKAPAPEIVEEVAEERKGPSLVWENDELPAAPRAKKRAHKPEGKVESWLGASTTQVDDPNVKVRSEECWRSYLAYCEDTGKQAIGRKLFSRKLGVLLGRSSGKSRKRDKNGSVFTGLMINQIVAQKKLRAAAA
jgi:hypothetical protein